MQSGPLDRLISIQRNTAAPSPSGEPIEAWTNIALRRAASKGPITGNERFASPEKVAYEQTEFRVRYSADVAALTPLDRVVEPALSQEQADDPAYVIPQRSIYDVLGVMEIGRREGLRILTQRRADVTT